MVLDDKLVKGEVYTFPMGDPPKPIKAVYLGTKTIFFNRDAPIHRFAYPLKKTSSCFITDIPESTIRDINEGGVLHMPTEVVGGHWKEYSPDSDDLSEVARHEFLRRLIDEKEIIP